MSLTVETQAYLGCNMLEGESETIRWEKARYQVLPPYGVRKLKGCLTSNKSLKLSVGRKHTHLETEAWKKQKSRVKGSRDGANTEKRKFGQSSRGSIEGDVTRAFSHPEG